MRRVRVGERGPVITRVERVLHPVSLKLRTVAKEVIADEDLDLDKTVAELHPSQYYEVLYDPAGNVSMLEFRGPWPGDCTQTIVVTYTKTLEPEPRDSQ